MAPSALATVAVAAAVMTALPTTARASNIVRGMDLCTSYSRVCSDITSQVCSYGGIGRALAWGRMESIDSDARRDSSIHSTMVDRSIHPSMYHSIHPILPSIDSVP